MPPRKRGKAVLKLLLRKTLEVSWVMGKAVSHVVNSSGLHVMTLTPLEKPHKQEMTNPSNNSKSLAFEELSKF